ncbi:hypothetical protein AAMO2058_000395800 [Amorphochlora amoebiformis]
MLRLRPSLWTASRLTRGLRCLYPGLIRRSFASDSKKLPSWATVDPYGMSGSAPAGAKNLVNGAWTTAQATRSIIDPMNGDSFLTIPDTSVEELGPFVDSMRSCPKSGLHNPLRNTERYKMLSEVCEKVATEMKDPEVEAYFSKLIQRCVGKHWDQCKGEVVVTQKWLATFCGDNVRNLSRSFGLPGDHHGQESRGYRWPFGHVAVITPFNFPLEIPLIQAISALFMGNKPLVKVDEKVQIVFEQMLRMMHACGLPKEDIDLLWSNGPVCMEALKQAECRMTLFTGSQRVAELLTKELRGKVKLEDAGFDWKILGPDVLDPEYVIWQCDQDAYAYSGQKCSAQSIVFMHSNWNKTDFIAKLGEKAMKRGLADRTLGPILTWSNAKIQQHIDDVSSLKGAKVLFGGKPLTGHSIPDCYGAFEATAVFVPLSEMLRSEENFQLVTKELFGPFQIVTEFDDSSVDQVIEACDRMESHLTAAVVSNDPEFQLKVLSNTVNGTTYVGVRARTTGAPQNHWFGPAGDPRSAGIHTPEAIKLVWSCHREIIYDMGRTPAGWTPPKPT